MTSSAPIVLVTSGFPRISETFALNEFAALDRAGAIAAIFATKPGDGRPLHPGTEALLERVRLIPPGPPPAQAEWVAEQVRPSRPHGFHAYFAHTPAAVAERAADAIGVPYSFSAHARDIRKVFPAELQRRAARAACVIACNEDAARDLRGMRANVELVPHGVDLGRFAPTPPPRPKPLRVLAVGRLVEKKGFAVLIDAVAGLTAAFRLQIVGAGPLRAPLEDDVARRGLHDRIEFVGALTHQGLPRAFAASHVVVVPSVQDADGDRDGLPNVVLEAMASGRPVVASEIAAIPSAIKDGRTGLLVPPGDPRALRAALERLAGDPPLRTRLAAAARASVEREFDLEACAPRLLKCLEAAYA